MRSKCETRSTTGSPPMRGRSTMRQVPRRRSSASLLLIFQVAWRRQPVHARVRAHSSRNSSLEAAGVPRQTPTDAKRPVGVISLIGGYGGTPSRDHFSWRSRNGKAMSRLGAPPTWPSRSAREALDLLAGVVFFCGTRKSGKQPVGIAAAIAEFTLRDLGIIELAQP